MISEIGHRYTIAEFEQFVDQPENRARRFELIDGAIVEKLYSEEHEFIAAYFAMYVGQFVVKRGLGRIVLTAYRHAPDDEYNNLLPDVSFTLRERLQPTITKRAVPQIPDLVIEVLAPDEQPEDQQAKVDYYLANGGQIVWVAHSKAHSITVCTPGKRITLTEKDRLAGGSLLPGFTLPVKDIFEID